MEKEKIIVIVEDIETVLMSLNYYKGQHFDEVWPTPPEINVPTPS